MQTTVVVLVALSAVLPADTASAWCWRPRAYAYGWGYRPWCGPRVVATYGCSSYAVSYSSCYGWGGYGWGGWRWPGYGTCGPVFASGCAYPAFVYGWYPGGLSVGWGYSGYGCGPLGFYGWGPFAAAAPGTTNRGLNVAAVAAAPVARPAVPAAGVAVHEPMRPRAASFSRPPASSTASRMRAGKLVATGDAHLRAGVDDDRRLGDALRAYDQAARIAADLPDTHLRRAIVLTAMGRADDARSAVRHAAAIDARLADVAGTAGGDATRRAPDRDLPPDPVFGDAAPGGPTTLDSRTDALLVRIFRPAGVQAVAARDGAFAANWIAARWQTRDGRSLPGGTDGTSSPTRLAAR